MEFADIVGFYFSDPHFFKKRFVHIITYYDKKNADLDLVLEEFSKDIFEYELFNIKQIGYLSCLSNEMYEDYGPDFYKLGMTKKKNKVDPSFDSWFIEPCKIHTETKKLSNCKIAQDILFQILDPYRLESNREFFKCSLDLIKESFQKIEAIFDGEEAVIHPLRNLNVIKIRLLDILKDNPELSFKVVYIPKKQI